MTLLDVVQNLDKLEAESTIYSSVPWTTNSIALVTSEEEFKKMNRSELKYFLEIFVARDFINDWISNSQKEFTIEEKCIRLIQYAITDA